MKPARSPRRRLIMAAALGLGAVVLVAGVQGVRSLWYGSPYPAVDPDAVSRRLDQRSQDVYEHFGLPPAKAATVRQERRDTGSCYYRGLQSLAHIDRPRRDVVTFGLDWNVPDVSEDEARAAVERLRSHLVADGWQLGHDRGGGRSTRLTELGFVFHEFAAENDPVKRGDGISVMWNSRGHTLVVKVYSPCGKVPDSFDRSSFDTSFLDRRPDWQPAGTGTTGTTDGRESARGGNG
ncbi:hypothetical protein ACH4SP_00780 [Streptomyces sp. NPDC021093]|uniref:hypothetical protein n=1 Tax=Streptomyces sp. NPDC021093 TaxID=3365112 RepID=UPI00379BFDD4